MLKSFLINAPSYIKVWLPLGYSLWAEKQTWDSRLSKKRKASHPTLQMGPRAAITSMIWSDWFIFVTSYKMQILYHPAPYLINGSHHMCGNLLQWSRLHHYSCIHNCSPLASITDIPLSYYYLIIPSIIILVAVISISSFTADPTILFTNWSSILFYVQITYWYSITKSVCLSHS